MNHIAHKELSMTSQSRAASRVIASTARQEAL
jgi:hypothetical protein